MANQGKTRTLLSFGGQHLQVYSSAQYNQYKKKKHQKQVSGMDPNTQNKLRKR